MNADIGEVKKKNVTRPAAKRKSHAGINLNTARLKKMIKKLLDGLESESNTSKASVSELLKLLQVYKELTTEQVKEVEVRWVDRLRAENESET